MSNPDSDHNMDEPRVRKMTDKGLQHRITLATKNFRSKVSIWNRSVVSVSQVIADEKVTEHIFLEQINIINFDLKNVVDSFEELALLCGDDVDVQLRARFEKIETDGADFIKQLSSEIRKFANDRQSNVGSRSSHHSHHSAESVKVTKLKTKLQLLDIEAEKVKVLSELKIAVLEEDTHSQSLPEADVMDKEELVPKSLPEVDVMDKEELVKKFLDTSQVDTKVKPSIGKPRKLVDVDLDKPEGSSASRHIVEVDMSKVCEQLVLSRLPLPELQIFCGNVLDYPEWKRAFLTLVDSRSIPTNERLYYLRSYLGGEAKECVAGYFMLSSPNAYEEAFKLLEKRYGDPFLIANAFRDKLESYQKIQSKDSKGLRRFVDFLQQCDTAMGSVPSLRILDDDRENKKILVKLPDWLIRRWSRVVSVSRSEHGKFPSFREFVRFLVKESDIANDPVTSFNSIKSVQNAKPIRTLSTAVSDGASSTLSCLLCNSMHHLRDCSKFVDLSTDERKDFVMKMGICFGCLDKGHRSRECQNRCVCTICTKRHHTAFHVDKSDTTMNRAFVRTSLSHMVDTNSCCKSSMIVPVWVSHVSNPAKEVLVYGMLDTQSDASFISTETCDLLNVVGPQVDLCLSTMAMENSVIKSNKVSGLQVRAFDGAKYINLPSCFSRNIMPAHRSHIPSVEMVDKWPHLHSIRDKLMPVGNHPIGLLIGYNCPQALVPREVIPPIDDGPFAQRSDLGWGIVGVVSHDDSNLCSVSHRIIACEVPSDLVVDRNVHSVQISCKTSSVKEIINPSDVLKVLEADFNDVQDTVKVSQEDRMFLKVMEDNIHKVDGHYEMPLPFKPHAKTLPNNKSQALSRLKQLKSRLSRDTNYRKEYTAFMNEIIDSGYAERVDSTDDAKDVWYIPHFGVHGNSRKLRVVFDCAARFENISLNDILMQGPDLTNSLIGVLCRFRKEQVAFMCDIQKMFYQFRVIPEHRDYLRFLWWDNDDYSSTPQVYRMTVHIFGACSSPSCSNFGLKQIALDNENEFGSDVAEFIRRDFYVDDGLKSTSDEATAVDLINKTIQMCDRGGLKLHKFVSNSKLVLSNIPDDYRTKSIQNVDLNLDKLPIQKVLGLEWNIVSDAFQFKISVKSRPYTRRGILSMVGSIYDPLGFIAPFTLHGKLILQKLCVQGYDWDDEISDDFRSSWDQWLQGLMDLDKYEVTRCLIPAGFGTIVSVSFHHFSDASTVAYGQCSYVRFVNQSNRVHVSFVMGKCRIAPKKQITVPRLELAAATISAKVANTLDREFDYDNVTHTFWTDSSVVLAYIKNDAKRFHVFVANRVELIRSLSDPNHWMFVKGNENPADIASRGLSVSDNKSFDIWMKGPDFLWMSDVQTDSSVSCSDLIDGDPEVKIRTLATVTNVSSFDTGRFNVSDWSRLVKSVAICLKYKFGLRKLVANKNRDMDLDRASDKLSLYDSITVVDLCEAEREIIRLVQDVAFAKEKRILLENQVRSAAVDRAVATNRNSSLKSVGSLHKLDCFIDAYGIIRVGGRLRNSELGFDEVHPVVLPKNHHVSQLIVKFCHERVYHQGRVLTRNELRSRGYWILGAKSLVSRLIGVCVICRKSRSRLQTQKMADLPADRVQASAPFVYCGVDYFGPFLIKDRRSVLKRYGVLFTCMASRAVHLEVANSLSTDSFINALRRFIAIRGPIRLLRSDQGTNFIGARRELKEALDGVDNNRVRDYLLLHSCDFEFKTNPPSASHMGGSWERLIRSVRSILDIMLSRVGSQLDDESLRTFMSEVAAVLNCRPLHVDFESDTLEPLTPNHVLTGKSQIILPPPGVFVREDLYLIKRWKRVQFLLNEFWKRWQKEYLHSLQLRQKWEHPNRNMKVGDIALIKDDTLPRNSWPLSRVVETYPSQDGLVRSVKLVVGDKTSNVRGFNVTYLIRPVHKLVVLVESD